MILTNRFSVCVCIAFVPFQWEITEIECLSCFGDFFVRFHIVCDRYTSDYDQITFSDTIWPLLLSLDFGTQMITLAETATYRGDSPKFSHCSQWRKNRMEISGPFRLSAISSPLRFKCTSYYSKASFFCRREPQNCPSLISGNAELAKVTNLKLWRKWNYCRDDLSAEL